MDMVGSSIGIAAMGSSWPTAPRIDRRISGTCKGNDITRTNFIHIDPLETPNVSTCSRNTSRLPLF